MLSKSYKSFQNQSTGSYQSAYCSCFSCSWHTHNKRVVFWKQHLFHCLFLRLIQTFKAEKITGKCLHFIIILARAIMFNFAIRRQVVQGLYCYLRNTSLKMFCDLLQFIFSDSLNVIDILLPFSIFLFIIPIFIFKHAKWIAQIASSCSEKKKTPQEETRAVFPQSDADEQYSLVIWIRQSSSKSKQTNNQGAWRIIGVLLKARICLQVWEGTVTPCLPVFVNPSFFSSSTYTFLSFPSPLVVC